MKVDESIICSVSTPTGSGGIAVIRLSGKGSIALTDKIFNSPSRKSLITCAANTLHFGEISEGKEMIDEVIVSLFHAPHSYTGEETVEISCHGSVYIQQQIMELLIRTGARSALPGEFTQRAFLNGKIDLSQAEAVTDLIASTSAGMHKLALQQMRGNFSSELMLLRNDLLEFVSLIELELDFSEEEVEFADRLRLQQLAKKIEQVITRLADSFSLGNAIKNGIPVAIIGETNAGKSTLLNLLVGEERAIVSDVHGTTRDTIEDTVNISGITFRFIDTAGIRETTNAIESMGIERTYQKLRQASVVIWVIDLTSSEEETEALASLILPHTVGKQMILVQNKTDLLTPEELESRRQRLSFVDASSIYISAKKRINTQCLQQELLKVAALPAISSSDVIITNVRHFEALTNARDAINRVIDGLKSGISGDFICQDIRGCMHYIGEITGQISNDEILGNIFSKFCIGK